MATNPGKWRVTEIPSITQVKTILFDRPASRKPFTLTVTVLETDKPQALPFPVAIEVDDIMAGINLSAVSGWFRVITLKGNVKNCPQLTNNLPCKAEVEVSFKMSESEGTLRIMEIL